VSSHAKNSTVSESKVHPGFLTITLSVVGRFLGRPYRSRPMPKQFCRLSVCRLSVLCRDARALCKNGWTHRDEFWHECCPGRKQHRVKIWWWSVQGLGYSAPKCRHKMVKFTLFHAFSCTVPKRVIRLRRFLAKMLPRPSWQAVKICWLSVQELGYSAPKYAPKWSNLRFLPRDAMHPRY